MAQELQDDFVGAGLGVGYIELGSGVKTKLMTKTPLGVTEAQGTRASLAKTFNKSYRQKLATIGDELEDLTQQVIKAEGRDYYDALTEVGLRHMENNPFIKDSKEYFAERARWSAYVRAMKNSGMKINEMKLGDLVIHESGSYRAFVTQGRNLSIKNDQMHKIQGMQIAVRRTDGKGWILKDAADVDLVKLEKEFLKLQKEEKYGDLFITTRANPTVLDAIENWKWKEGRTPWTNDYTNPRVVKIREEILKLAKKNGLNSGEFNTYLARMQGGTHGRKTKKGIFTMKGNEINAGANAKDFFPVLKTLQQADKKGLLKEMVELGTEATISHEMGHVLSQNITLKQREMFLEAVWKAESRGWINPLTKKVYGVERGVLTNTEYPATYILNGNRGKVKNIATYYEELFAEAHAFYMMDDLEGIPQELTDFFNAIYSAEQKGSLVPSTSIWGYQAEEILKIHNRLTSEIYGKELTQAGLKRLLEVVE